MATRMFDLVVRMLDDKGNEVLPSEFLAAAERTDLMKNIDRWVIGAAMSFCAARKPHRVFVRMSHDSMRDQTLGTWLHQQLKASGIDASRVVVEISEELATRHLKEAKELRSLVTHLGFEFAIENFGSGRDSQNLLRHLPSNYVKIDGALMQGLANDRPLQEQVKALVEHARAAQGRDDRRARRGCQHDGRAVAARRRVRAGLLRLEPGGGGAGNVTERLVISG